MMPARALSVTVLASRFRPERYGGVEERLWRMTRALARAGADVLVVTENNVGAAEHETFEAGLQVQRIAVRDAGRLWRTYYAVKSAHWRSVAAGLRRDTSVWATEPPMVIGTRLAGRGHRIVFHPAACAAGMHHIWRRRPAVYTMKMPFDLRIIDRLAYWWADDVIVSSANVKRQFELFYGKRERVHVIPFGADNDEVLRTRRRRSDLDIADDAFTIGFVGRLDPCKDVPFLLDSIVAMSDREKVKLVIVGSGPDEGHIRSIAEAKGLSGNIIWTGRVDDAREFFSVMDVLVLPSVYEAFGLVLLEAMAEGVPVIGRLDNRDTVFTATDEIVKPGAGFVIAAEDPRRLTDALESLRQSPERRRAMGAQAARVARAWTWDDAAAAYLQLVHD